MSSQKRRDASRNNVALGGPKSPEGKKKSSQNARKHGLYAHSLSTENQKAYDEYRQTFFDEWQPATPTEDLLVHELAMTSWHLRRLSTTQNWLLEDEMAMQHDALMKRYVGDVLQRSPRIFPSPRLALPRTRSAPSRAQPLRQLPARTPARPQSRLASVPAASTK
jgi:hypothetical protein